MLFHLKLEILVLFKALLLFKLKSSIWSLRSFPSLCMPLLRLSWPQNKFSTGFRFRLEIREELAAKYIFYLRNPVFCFLNLATRIALRPETYFASSPSMGFPSLGEF
ncbi:hypothetical protein SLA2020_335230 [Shorea laevis]